MNTLTKELYNLMVEWGMIKLSTPSVWNNQLLHEIQWYKESEENEIP